MRRFTVMLTAVVLGTVVAFAGVISVPQFNDGGGNTNSNFFPASASATFIALKNNTSTTQTYTVLYYSLTGGNRTPAVNTFTIAGNASVGWRPVADDPNEGALGQAVPNATGAGGSGSATILYSDSVDPSGRVFVNAGATLSSYGFALFPAQ